MPAKMRTLFDIIISFIIIILTIFGTYTNERYNSVCVCVFVCVKERDRKRKAGKTYVQQSEMGKQITNRRKWESDT